MIIPIDIKVDATTTSIRTKGNIQVKSDQKCVLEFAGHKGWDNDPQRQPLRLCPCGRHIRSGELTEQLQRAVLRLIQHEFLQRHLSFFINSS